MSFHVIWLTACCGPISCMLGGEKVAITGWDVPINEDTDGVCNTAEPCTVEICVYCPHPSIVCFVMNVTYAARISMERAPARRQRRLSKISANVEPPPTVA